MTDRTIEDVLQMGWTNPSSLRPLSSQAIESLTDATADGPVFSADGSLVVHRTDPELAERLTLIADWMARHHGYPLHLPPLMVSTVRDAALLAAPAHADPEEDGDE